MEFNIDTNKVIGIVDHKLGGESARIKVLAIIDSNKKIKPLTEQESIKLFSPKGFIFEPSFFYHYSFNERDVISFFAIENEQSGIDKDRFRINGRNDINNYGVNARHINGFKKTGYSTNLSLIHIDKNEDQSNGNFYGITNKYIIGKLKMHDGKITPSLHNRIKVWDISDVELIEYNGIIRLIKDPDGESLVLDCMNDKQLFEWFRNALKEIEPDYVNMLDKKAIWRNELPKLLSEADKERYEVDTVRLKRIKEKFEFIDLSISDIKTLIEKSNTLRKTFNKAIETHKKEWKKSYQNELEECSIDIEKQKELLTKELVALQNSKKEKKMIFNSLKNEIENLNQNKERILSDFSIIKDVLSIESNTGKSISKQSDSFILESIEEVDDATLFSSREEFISELKFRLYKYQLFPNFAKRLLNLISIYKGIFIKDIRLGVAFAEATNNTKYIIQQVEPDWLHFNDFWNNGLGAIWQSANNQPDVLHFLFLEDINMSSPECYARPLLDMINGIRKQIPFGKTTYPKNLKIFVTKTSTTDPKIGLPLIEQTFTGWGAVGFNGDIFKKTDNEYETVKGFINSKLLISFQPDEFEIADIKSSVQQDFNNIFETE